MAALVGDSRKRSSTAGSTELEEEEDRIVLLSGEGLSNVNTDSEMSDDNHEESVLKLIKSNEYSSGIEYSRRQLVARKSKHVYRKYCTQRYVDYDYKEVAT